jgi:hypothetical protein
MKKFSDNYVVITIICNKFFMVLLKVMQSLWEKVVTVHQLVQKSRRLAKSIRYKYFMNSQVGTNYDRVFFTGQSNHRKHIGGIYVRYEITGLPLKL